jgi:hypothetical protein
VFASIASYLIELLKGAVESSMTLNRKVTVLGSRPSDSI